MVLTNRTYTIVPILIMAFWHTGALSDCVPPPLPSYVLTTTSEKTQTFGSWDAYVDKDPEQCWIVSNPISTIVSPDLDPDGFCRKTPNLSILYQPDRNISGEVSFMSGFLFDTSKDIRLQIGDETFVFSVTDVQYAWLSNQRKDEKILSLMKQRESFEIYSTASGGETVKDTFSLKGFNETLVSARTTCGPQFLGM